MQAVKRCPAEKMVLLSCKKKKKKEDLGKNSHSLVADHNIYTCVSEARQTSIQLPPVPFTSSVILTSDSSLGGETYSYAGFL